MADSQTIIPPFVGIVHTTRDALLLFEGARRSLVPRIARRLFESEKHLLTSGAIFIFDELESGIKRWTDGLVWSPSRIMSNFVVYREANQRTDRRSKRARGQPAFTTSSHTTNSSRTSSSSSSTSSNSPGFQIYYPDEIDADGSDDDEIRAIDEEDIEGERRNGGASKDDPSSSSKRTRNPISEREEREKEIVGSLMPSSRYKTNGLIKKTISISINGVAQHLVSYFTMEDALMGQLKTPSSVPELASISIPDDLLQNQQFRVPPDDDSNESGTFQCSSEQTETTPSSPRLPSTRRATSAEPLLLAPPTSADIIPAAPVLKRKRSYSLATTYELETLAEERRRNSFPLPSYASHYSPQLHPPNSTSPPSWSISRPEARRNAAFLSPMQENASSMGSALTPGSLQRTMDSIDAYEIHGTHAGWKAGEGLEDGMLEEKRRRTGSSERDASTTMDWDPQQPHPQPSSSSSLSSSSTMEGPTPSYYYLPYDHPSIHIHPPPPLLPPVRPLSSAKSYFPPAPQFEHEHGRGYGMMGDLGGVTLGMEHEREEIVKWVGEGKEVGVQECDQDL